MIQHHFHYNMQNIYTKNHKCENNFGETLRSYKYTFKVKDKVIFFMSLLFDIA